MLLSYNMAGMLGGAMFELRLVNSISDIWVVLMIVAVT